MNDDIPSGAEFEAMTIRLASAGDTDAGLEALRLCATGLYANNLSEPLRFYLARCLLDLTDGIQADRAMNVEVERGKGRPANPFPEWETPLAAFGALLHRRGYIAARIEEAMSDARRATEGKDLDSREARRIRKKYAAMELLDDDLLIHLCGDQKMRGEIDKFPPVP